jgi:crossover junction endodeoxyribonuclease RusA
MISFTLPLPPSANRYWRRAGKHLYISQEARAYKRDAAITARLASVKPLDGNLAVSLRIYRQRKAGDLDNKIKVCLDALNGIAYHDDNQIVEIHAYRYDDKANPRVEIDIHSK